MSEKTSKILKAAGKFKYPLIILALGILLMLLPTGKAQSRGADANASDEEERMEYVLSSVSGAGDVRVMLSDSGAVVVCQGADDAGVRLDVMNAVCAYTGLTSDRVTILKIQDKLNGEAAK